MTTAACGREYVAIATSQNTSCDGPSFAAVPTHPDPTTNTTCISTRSARPSSRRSSWEALMGAERTGCDYEPIVGRDKHRELVTGIGCWLSNPRDARLAQRHPEGSKN